MIRISREHVIYTLGKAHPPVASIDPGTEVRFETWDARTGTIRSERDLLDKPHPKGPNPVTGPVLVCGAELATVAATARVIMPRL
jgi:acetamidase/formamidase